jgi:uncharacterized RDD family membrane protein YckC
VTGDLWLLIYGERGGEEIMAKWWYAKNEERKGPVGVDELAELIRTGKVGLLTKVSEENTEDWKPLEAVEKLKMLRETYAPKEPLGTGSDNLNEDFASANAWPRFFARIFDTWLESFVLGFFVGIFLALFFPLILGFVQTIFGGIVFNILMLPLALVLDAILATLFGNTLGKVMLGLKVRNAGGERLNFSHYVRRNFGVWTRGLGLGIPIVNMVVMIIQASRVSDGKPTSYDETPGYRVVSKRIGRFRMALIVSVVCVLFVSLVGFRVYKSLRNQGLIPMEPVQGESWTWKNPITDLSTQVESAWRQPQVRKSEVGDPIYLFIDKNEKASIVLGFESSADLTVKGYMEAYLAAVKGKMRFKDEGKFHEYRGCPAWEDSGWMNMNSNVNLNVKVVQVGDVFWRVVCLQDIPYDYSTKLIEHLEDSLWNTIVPPDKKPVDTSTVGAGTQTDTLGDQ